MSQRELLPSLIPRGRGASAPSHNSEAPYPPPHLNPIAGLTTQAIHTFTYNQQPAMERSTPGNPPQPPLSSPGAALGGAASPDRERNFFQPPPIPPIQEPLPGLSREPHSPNISAPNLTTYIHHVRAYSFCFPQPYVYRVRNCYETSVSSRLTGPNIYSMPSIS
jgi:hypothetical protein